jgi:hypothetical protein
LDPVMFDAGGRQVEVLVDTADTAQTTTGGGEELLDAAD